MSVPVPERELSPNAPLRILIVVEFAAPPAPARFGEVGAVVNISVETLAAGLEPKLVPRKSTLAPADREKDAKVIVDDPPAPGVIVTIL
jgi:hypothetical protein